MSYHDFDNRKKEPYFIGQAIIGLVIGAIGAIVYLINEYFK